MLNKLCSAKSRPSFSCGTVRYFKNSPQVSRLPLVFIIEEATISRTYLFFVCNFSSLGAFFDEHFRDVFMRILFFSWTVCCCLPFSLSHFNCHYSNHRINSEFTFYNKINFFRNIPFPCTRFLYDFRSYSSLSFIYAFSKFLISQSTVLNITRHSRTYAINLEAVVHGYNKQRADSKQLVQMLNYSEHDELSNLQILNFYLGTYNVRFD